MVRGSWLLTPGFGGRHLHERRINDQAGSNLWQAADDHSLARLQSLLNGPQSVVECADANRTRDDFILIVDDVEDPLSLIVVERTVADEQGGMGATDRQTC